MDQPIPRWEPFTQEAELFAALGVERSGCPSSNTTSARASSTSSSTRAEQVAALDPDLRALVRVLDDGVYCFARDGARWKSRMFAPADGVAEDPATGSAAGPLAMHLARHGRIGFGEEIEITQGVEIGRPSTLYARVEGTPDEIERVRVGGSAVVVARGEFRIP